MASVRRMMPAALLMLCCLVASASATFLMEIRPVAQDAPAAVLQSDYNATIIVNVTDDAQHRISGALVSIIELPGVTQITNLTGVAVFTGLYAPANVTTYYHVWASKEGYGNSTSNSAAVTMEGTSYADLELDAADILGTVSDSSGPIANATVYIAVLGYSTTTASDGKYQLGGVTGGLVHSVTASAAGYLNDTETIYVDVGDYAVRDFLLVSKTGSISGTVSHATSGEPLYRANVSTVMSTLTGNVTVTATTDLNGDYRIPNLPAGTYAVTASLEGFNSSTLTGISVVMDVETTGVDFALEEKPTRLYGTVKAGTVLLVGVNVSVMDTPYYAISDIEGEYEILNIPAGAYMLQVAREGYVSIIVTGVVVPRGGETHQDIELEGLPGALRGVVFGGDLENPLPGVTVTIVSTQRDERSRTTNINGEFEFTGLSPGNYTVYFELEGYKPREIGPIQITVEGAVDLNEIVLSPVSEGIGGFVPGQDLPHSMMILGLVLTIIILTLAVVIRMMTFESPEKSPAVYDTEEEPPKEAEGGKPDEKTAAENDEGREGV